MQHWQLAPERSVRAPASRREKSEKSVPLARQAATHAGVLLGRIIKIRGNWVTVEAGVALERFDGLRLVPQKDRQVSHALPRDGQDVRCAPCRHARHL